MKNNIFENAKFGDKFITQYDKNPFVIFLHTGYQSCESEEIDEYRCIIVINEIFIFLCYDKNGICLNADSKYNIVSRYQEPINEDKLDKLVHQYIDQWGDTLPKTIMAWVDGFKVGYRKAMEE